MCVHKMSCHGGSGAVVSGMAPDHQDALWPKLKRQEHGADLCLIMAIRGGDDSDCQITGVRAAGYAIRKSLFIAFYADVILHERADIILSGIKMEDALFIIAIKQMRFACNVFFVTPFILVMHTVAHRNDRALRQDNRPRRPESRSEPLRSSPHQGTHPVTLQGMSNKHGP